MSRYLKLIAINILVFAGLLLLIEGASRLMIDKAEIEPIFNDAELRTRNRAFVEPHATRGFALKPGFENKLYRVNSDGFRGEDFPEDLDRRFIVLTLGESTTF